MDNVVVSTVAGEGLPWARASAYTVMKKNWYYIYQSEHLNLDENKTKFMSNLNYNGNIMKESALVSLAVLKAVINNKLI